MLGFVVSGKLSMMTCAGSPGVALTVALGELCPTLFTALTRKSYDVRFERLVTVAVVFVLVPSANTDHVPPVVSLYSMT
jgi:hypothetical protein